MKNTTIRATFKIRLSNDTTLRTTECTIPVGHFDSVAEAQNEAGSDKNLVAILSAARESKQKTAFSNRLRKAVKDNDFEIVQNAQGAEILKFSDKILAEATKLAESESLQSRRIKNRQNAVDAQNYAHILALFNAGKLDDVQKFLQQRTK